jgi:nucleotide-binding universal stress UspA family protein
MKKILVILDREDDQQYVLERAIVIAEKFNCCIHVLIYGYCELSWVNDVFGMLENNKLKEKLVQHKEDWWQEYSKPYLAKKNVTHEVVCSKYFVDTILKHCVEHQYELIVKQGHRSKSIFYTPSDWLLLRDSKIPIYLVVSGKVFSKPSISKHSLSRKVDSNAAVLVALDFLASSEEKQTLNSKLLSVANDFAKKSGVELHCCFAIAVPKVLAETGFIDIEKRSQVLSKLAQEKAKILLADYPIAESNIHISVGTPWKVIKRQAEKINAGLTIIGSMGKTAIAGKLIGNTSEQVLNFSKKDVLVIGLNEP